MRRRGSTILRNGSGRGGGCFCGFSFGGALSWSRTFRTPATPQSALRRGMRWLSYFRLPESVTLPCITTALIPEPRRRSVATADPLTSAEPYRNWHFRRTWFDPFVRGEKSGPPCKTQASGRGIDHRGRGRTVKEDLPPAIHSILAAVLAVANLKRLTNQRASAVAGSRHCCYRIACTDDNYEGEGKSSRGQREGGGESGEEGCGFGNGGGIAAGAGRRAEVGAPLVVACWAVVGFAPHDVVGGVDVAVEIEVAGGERRSVAARTARSRWRLRRCWRLTTGCRAGCWGSLCRRRSRCRW